MKSFTEEVKDLVTCTAHIQEIHLSQKYQPPSNTMSYGLFCKTPFGQPGMVVQALLSVFCEFEASLTKEYIYPQSLSKEKASEEAHCL